MAYAHAFKPDHGMSANRRERKNIGFRSYGGAGSPSERVFAQEFPAIRKNSKDGRKKSLLIAGPADFP